MVRQNCFAYDSLANGCRVLIKRDCDNCKFYKTANDDGIEKLNCELRIRRVYGMSSKEFLKSRRTNEND